LATTPPTADVVARVRCWDLAATEQGPGKRQGKDPDWTVGELWSRTKDGRFFIENVIRFRGTPLEVEQAIANTAKLDGSGVRIRLPQDPGQAGKAQAANFIRMLAGYNLRAKQVTGDKVTRAGPFSAQVEGGNVYVVEHSLLRGARGISRRRSRRPG
jgi:predicted phage terminase large subunit-like protein